MRTPLTRLVMTAHREPSAHGHSVPASDSGDDPPRDHVDRRGFLNCMSWAGAGMLWSVHGGVPTSSLLGAAGPKRGELSFVQIHHRRTRRHGHVAPVARAQPTQRCAWRACRDRGETMNTDDLDRVIWEARFRRLPPCVGGARSRLLASSARGRRLPRPSGYAGRARWRGAGALPCTPLGCSPRWRSAGQRDRSPTSAEQIVRLRTRSRPGWWTRTCARSWAITCWTCDPPTGTR